MDLKGFKPKKLGSRLKDVDGIILGNIQVAKEGNPHFPPEMSVYRIEGRNYVVMHEGQSPSPKSVDLMEDQDYFKIYLDRTEVNIIVQSIMFWEENKAAHINPYTTVYTYCKLNGLDLVERKVFRL